MSPKSQKLQIVGGAFTAVALAALATAVSFSKDALAWETLIAIGVLGLMAAFATNLDTEVRSGFSLCGDVMVVMAAIVVFHERAVFSGAALVAAFVGIYWPHIRRREWHKIAVNASVESLALLSATAVVWLVLEPGADIWALSIAVAVAAATYLVVNAFLLGIPVSIASEESYRVVVRQLGSFNSSALPFAMLGLGLGWVYLELGAGVVPLLVVPIFIARRTFASYLELRAAQEQTIETLVLALEAKDGYTAGHAQRVASFCAYIGTALTLSPARMERLRYAALMHDIGKLIVPNQLLNKPGRLTESEFERVRRHEGVSVELLRRIDFLAPIAGDTTTEAATAAVGGAGLIEPAIIHVADAFDAMTSTRSYRRALSQETAFAELRDGSGTQFNAQCVDALIAAIEERGEHYGAGHEVEAHEWETAPPEVGTGSAGLGNLAPDPPSAGSHSPRQLREQAGTS